MRRPNAVLLIASACLLAGGCAARSGSLDDGATREPARTAAQSSGALIGEGVGLAASAALASSAATDAARAALSLEVNRALNTLADDLRPAVLELDDPAALHRFENARHLAASETLRHAAPVEVAAYLEPDGGYSATATIRVDADEPALRLYDELRRIGRFDERLSASSAWQGLRERASARLAERAAASPLPPVGASG